VVGSTVGVGGTTVCDTGPTGGFGWQIQGSVFKCGAAGSNTQLGIHNQAQMGSNVAMLISPTEITAIESGPILIAVTGNVPVATTDIVFNFLEINATN
jgi:hypothetical protein